MPKKSSFFPRRGEPNDRLEVSLASMRGWTHLAPFDSRSDQARPIVQRKEAFVVGRVKGGLRNGGYQQLGRFEIGLAVAPVGENS